VLQIFWRRLQLNHGDLESGIYCSRNLGFQHTFDHRFIRNEIMKGQMDSIVRGLWLPCQPRLEYITRPRGGIQASQYFESLKVWSAGARSWGLIGRKIVSANLPGNRQLKCVPDTAQFPHFVRPSKGYTAQMIDESLVCRNERQLEDDICCIELRLCISRLQWTCQMRR
jgi:hypothetical protein